MAEDFQEKEHLPTPKKLTELRKNGVVLRSRDLTAGLVLLLCLLSLLFTIDAMNGQLRNVFYHSFTIFRDYPDYSSYFATFLKKTMLNLFFVLLPLMVMGFLACFASSWLFGGWYFSLTSLKFDFSKLNPITNISKIFSPKRISVEILKSFVKFLLLFLVSIAFIYIKHKTIFLLIQQSPHAAIMGMYALIKSFLFVNVLAIISIVGIDAAYQHYTYMKQAKMTSQEIKDEQKDTEGSADVKRKVRSTQFSLFKQRLSLTVPKATIIITNPTHYAVALRYRESRDNAPALLAKGVDQMAQQIRYYATTHGIPIYEAPVLARAIFHTTKIGMEIHPKLYMAVAIVLSYINQLKRYQMGVGVLPQPITNYEIPEDFIYDS